MSDILQPGPITTLHLLESDVEPKIEQEIEEASNNRPIALVLPSLVSEMDGPALGGIMEVLKSVDYLSEIVVTLGPASREEFERACSFFQPLQKPGRRVRIIWNDGDRIEALYDEIRDAGLTPGPQGKGRSAWMAYGYVVARGEAYVIALHDCDIVTYDKNLLNRLVYPTVMPDLDYEFCKGYYCRVTDRLYGRVCRLLVSPLITSLIRILGNLPILDYLTAFRYPLAGEFSMIADLSRISRIPADWGLEVGVLAEVFRNCSPKRICQVELCHNYEHKHQALSQDDPEKGLNKMAIDICGTIFRTLFSSGVVLSAGFFNTLRATFLKEAQDLMVMYHDDSRINGLHHDRHAEALAIEMFTKAVRVSGEQIQIDPLGRPLIPQWNRVFAAVPRMQAKLVESVDADNQPYFE
ncbi:glycosyl transferase [Thermodesulfobacteriota bacterium]